MTNQELFDKIVTHLAKQQHRCVDKNERCAYRFNNYKCAIGALIPNEKYKPKFENVILCFQTHRFVKDKTRVVYEILDAANIDISQIELARDLQCAHDSYCDVAGIQHRLNELARNFKLDNSLVKTITRWDTYPPSKDENPCQEIISEGMQPCVLPPLDLELEPERKEESCELICC